MPVVIHSCNCKCVCVCVHVHVCLCVCVMSNVYIIYLHTYMLPYIYADALQQQSPPGCDIFCRGSPYWVGSIPVCIYIYVLHFIRLIECSEPLFISRCQILPYNIHLAFGSSR